jgi:hypothetical protein
VQQLDFLDLFMITSAEKRNKIDSNSNLSGNCIPSYNKGSNPVSKSGANKVLAKQLLVTFANEGIPDDLPLAADYITNAREVESRNEDYDDDDTNEEGERVLPTSARVERRL